MAMVDKNKQMVKISSRLTDKLGLTAESQPKK